MSNDLENHDALTELLARAEKAKSIKDEIDMLVAFEASEQRRSISFQPLNYSRVGMNPSEDIVLAIFEIGRQERLKVLKANLSEVLTDRAPLAETNQNLPREGIQR